MTRLALPLALLLAAPALAQDDPAFTAGGNEPGWSLALALSGISLTRMGDKGVATWPLPRAGTTADGRVYAVPDGPTVTIAATLCRDDATGMPYPSTVTVLTDGDTLTGCGGDPATLLRRNPWRITHVDAAPFPADAPLEGTMAFDATGAVSGKSFCNRYTGTYTLTGEGLAFGPVAGTRMACPEPQAGLENAMLAALGKVSRFDIGGDGALMLIAGDSVVLRAVPAPR